MADIADSVIALSHLLKPFDLSHVLNPDKSLSDETQQRVDKCIELYNAQQAKTITMSGAHNFNNWKNEPCTHAYGMTVYAFKREVPVEDIVIEDHSLDTVGQAIFTKVVHAVPRGWKDIIVVSSDYHLDRVRAVFDFVYGPGTRIRYESTPTDEQTRAERAITELKGIAMFQKQFEGVTQGNTEEIVKRLLDPEKGHPFYNGKKLIAKEILAIQKD